jgi:hypothetical protein
MRTLIEPTAKPITHYQVVHRRMKESFMPMYQTILSIIQGVDLADLAALVVAKYPQLTVVHWLMVLTTFFMLIVVYSVYSIQAAVWDWIPDIRDASIPFLFRALELFVNHAIVLSTSLWFVDLAGVSALGAVGAMHLVWRAREESENTELLRLLRPQHRLFILNYIGGVAIALLCAYLCYIGNLQASDGLQGTPGQVVGQLRSPEKLLRVLAIDLHGLKEGCPSPMQLQEDLIGDLGGKRLVGIRLFEQMKRRRVIEVVLLENE